MELLEATRGLSALAQPSRLQVFRLLIQAGPEGLAAGDIARSLTLAPNTLTAQLHILVEAGLIHSERLGRNVIYRADPEAITQLVTYLVEDCCGGRPEVCAPLSAVLELSCS